MKNQSESTMNLSQNQMDVKQAYLNHQQEQILLLYQNAPRSERNAIIKHVDGFLSTCNPDEKRFWLKFRRKLEVMNEKSVMFPLGSIYLTAGASAALNESGQEPFEFLSRHQRGDWGEICEADKGENELSLREGFRLLSAYRTKQGVKLWCITEHNRSVTTLLLPEEY
jgi:hypothetical protein